MIVILQIVAIINMLVIIVIIISPIQQNITQKI